MTFNYEEEEEEYSLMDVYDEAKAAGLTDEEVEEKVDEYIAQQVEIYGEDWLKTYRDN